MSWLLWIVLWSEWKEVELPKTTIWMVVPRKGSGEVKIKKEWKKIEKKKRTEKKRMKEGEIRKEEREKKEEKWVDTLWIVGYKVVRITPQVYHRQQKKQLKKLNLQIEWQDIGEKWKVDTTLDRHLTHYLTNFQQKEKWYEGEKREKYTIVVKESNKHIIENFVKWKVEMGYEVEVVSWEEEKEINIGKYGLLIGKGKAEIKGGIVGYLPYEDSVKIKKILNQVIEYELNSSEKKILIVRGVANFENERQEKVEYEDKERLAQQIREMIPQEWVVEEFTGEIVEGEYSLINFLTLGKQWMKDDGDNVAEEEEIRIKEYYVETSSIIFSPFWEERFLTKGVAVVMPEENTYYTVGWEDTLDGGNGSFNYWFMVELLKENRTVGEAYLLAKLKYETLFPSEEIEFKIWGDPTVRIYNTKLQKDVEIKTKIDEKSEWKEVIGVVKNWSKTEVEEIGVECVIKKEEGEIVDQWEVKIDTLQSEEEKEVKFVIPEKLEEGKSYWVKLILIYEEDTNPLNDVDSVKIEIPGSDFIIWDTVGGELEEILKKYGYKGRRKGEEVEGCKIMIIPDNKEVESLVVKNVYVEGNNLYLKKFFKGKVVEREIQDSLLWKEGKVKVIGKRKMEWFIIEGSEMAFWDKEGNEFGFYYEGEGYRIWATAFKIGEIDSTLRDSILLYGIEKILQKEKKKKKEEKKKIEVKPTYLQEIIVSPNPFYTETEIKFVITDECIIDIGIYDLTGKRVKSLKEGKVGKGFHRVKWDGKDDVGKEVRNGVYFLKVVANRNEKKFSKLIIFK